MRNLVCQVCQEITCECTFWEKFWGSLSVKEFLVGWEDILFLVALISFFWCLIGALAFHFFV